MWVVIALASLGTIIILTLCVPLNMALHADVYGKPKLRLKLVWLFGLVSKEITREKKPEEKKRVVEEKRKPEGEKKRFRDIFEILRTRGLLKQLKSLLKNILSRFKIRDLTADFKVGLGDRHRVADFYFFLFHLVEIILFNSLSVVSEKVNRRQGITSWIGCNLTFPCE